MLFRNVRIPLSARRQNLAPTACESGQWAMKSNGHQPDAMEDDGRSIEALRDANSLAALAIKEQFSWMAAIVSYLPGRGAKRYADTKDTIMKLTTIALASAFALFSTLAFAQPESGHRLVRTHRGPVEMNYAPTYRLQPNYGNPNGNPDGPTTLSGTGDSQFGGSSPGTSGYN
jgi:hypothetical protein